jgi:CheY-like chemotaxis protein
VFPAARVLVVDDSNENRELVRLVLEEVGLTVELAENGQVAVDKAVQTTFNVILMDIQMPVMDGYTATAQLRSQGLELPIIALSAHAMKGFETKILEAGFSGSVTKPIDIDLLLEHLAELLGGKRQAAAAAGPAVAQTAEAVQSPLQTAPPLVSRLADKPRLHPAIRTFAERLDGQLAAMQQAAEKADFEALADLAHWLKGAGGTVGYDAFTKPAAQLEQHAKAHDQGASGETIELLQQLAGRLVIPGDEVDALSQETTACAEL